MRIDYSITIIIHFMLYCIILFLTFHKTIPELYIDICSSQWFVLKYSSHSLNMCKIQIDGILSVLFLSPLVWSVQYMWHLAHAFPSYTASLAKVNETSRPSIMTSPAQLSHTAQTATFTCFESRLYFYVFHIYILAPHHSTLTQFWHCSLTFILFHESWCSLPALNYNRPINFS